MRRLETTVDLLDALQEKLGCDSDNQVAQRMGIPQTSLSNWRRGRTYPTEGHAFKIADVLGIPPTLVLVIAAADRTEDQEARERWQKMLRQIARAGFGVLAGIGVLTGTYAPPAQAEGANDVSSVKSRRRRPAQPIAA